MSPPDSLHLPTTPASTLNLPLTTQRLVLRELSPADAAFILELLNEEGFLRYIGDRGVNDLASAERYIVDGPVASYAEHGYGLWRVELRDGGEPIGICGLINRASLEHPDIGFAFLERHGGKGYAYEAAHATMDQALRVLHLPAVLAIVQPYNHASIRLLGKLGMRLRGVVEHGGPPESLRVYVIHAQSPR